MKYSVLVPVKNEEDNIIPLIDEITPVMNRLGEPWEMIFVDDGSTDRSLEILTAEKAHHNNLRLIVFEKNFGQSSAFDAGFRAARGTFVITLDGDRQNDPADIPKLLAEIDNADLVCGKRAARRDPLSKRLTSKVANAIRRRLCRDGISDTGCSLKVYRKECLDKIKLFNGMHRFLPALFAIEGFRIREVPVNHRERLLGSTKYTFFNRSFAIFDMFAVHWMRKRHLHYQVEREL